MTADALYCTECHGEVGLLRVARGVLMLGHKRTPPTLHPVRSDSPDPAMTSREDVIAGIEGSDPSIGGAYRTVGPPLR